MKSFEKGWKIFVVHTVEIVQRVSKLFTSHIWKTILKFFAALFLQLWNFRVFLFLTFFAKSINKVTRRDYVNWGTLRLSEFSPKPKLVQLTVPVPSGIFYFSKSRNLWKIWNIFTKFRFRIFCFSFLIPSRRKLCK